ncbi:MAG: hypothetical protein ALAOOOJD_01026 [bacterium]|nr:hypothetical protein [bacterium]
MIRRNLPGAGSARIQRRRKAGRGRKRANIIAGKAPRDGLIAEINAAGIITGGVHDEDLIRRQRCRP